jgi:hypothetical protein
MPAKATPKQLLVNVVSDLKAMKAGLAGAVDEHSLRRLSGMLRGMLVHGDLQRAWKGAGFEREPQIKAITLAELLRTEELANIEIATAGGAEVPIEVQGKRGTSTVAGFQQIFRPAAEPPVEPQVTGTPGEGPDYRLMKLSEFTYSPCLILDGVKFNRYELVTYVANKLGGVHYDLKRTAKPIDRKYAKLDASRRRFVVNLDGASKDLVYFELLATAQAILNSEDIQALIERGSP